MFGVWYVVWYVVWLLFGTSFGMIRCSVCCEHVVGYMARYAVGYTLLWDTLLMRYVVGVIGCCVMRVVIVWFKKVVFR